MKYPCMGMTMYNVLKLAMYILQCVLYMPIFKGHIRVGRILFLEILYQQCKMNSWFYCFKKDINLNIMYKKRMDLLFIVSYIRLSCVLYKVKLVAG